jgi:hypothetical protein
MMTLLFQKRIGHGFHETKQGVRYTISEAARPAKILARLLKLNHERYADEVAQGLHEKKTTNRTNKTNQGKKKVNADDGPSLFDQEGDA